MRRIVWCLVFACILASAANTAYHLTHVLLLEARGAVESDGSLFLIVGRGLLNGLLPYADLFESKPPGMFFLFVLSLMTTGDDRLAIILQVGIILAFPLMLARFAWMEARKQPGPFRKYFVTALALVLGSLLALYLEEHGGSLKSESFGAFFACLYLLHVVVRREASAKTAVLINSCLLLGSFGFKEPFILSTLAATLLVTRDRKHFVYVFVLPLVIAISLGTAVLAVLGYLGPYLSLYLPAMMTARLSAETVEPHWVRGFAAGRLFFNLNQFSRPPFFGGVFAALWLMAPALKTHAKSTSTLLLTLATSGAAYAFLISTRIFLVMLYATILLPLNFENSKAFLAIRLGMYVMLFVLFVALLFFENKRGVMVPTIQICAALYLTCIAVGVAEYAFRHWGFAVPLLFALVLLFLRYAAKESPRSPLIVTVTLLTVAAGLLYQSNPNHLQFMNRLLERHDSITKKNLAPRLDELLDRCQIANYFTDDSLALARHSPLGPIFVPREHTKYLPPDHPLLQQTYANIRNKAQLIVLASGSSLNSLLPDLDRTFTEEASPCSDGLLPIADFRFFFRRTPLPP